MTDFKGSEELRAKNRKAAAKYRLLNLEVCRKANREYAALTRGHRFKTHKEWVNKNKEYVAEYAREWRKKSIVVRSRIGDARTGNAMPLWANKFIIKEIYALAKLRTKLTGNKWEVDHVIPINGRTVCGLHVENNLQVIPMFINRSKGNKYAH